MSRPVQKPLLAYSPLIKNGIPKLEPDTQGYDDYWEEQRYYCVNGYRPRGEYSKISGKHFFHLNAWKIDRLVFPFDNVKGQTTVIANPLYRKYDHEIIEHNAACRQSHKNAIYGKFRRSALTDICLSDIAHELLFNKQARCAWCVPAETHFTNTLPKFYTGMANLPSGLYQDILVDNDREGCIIGYERKDDYGNWVRDGCLSSLTKKIFSKAGILKGAKQRVILMDEVGDFDKNPTLRQCYAETDQCVVEGGFRFGFIILAGTSDKINNKSMDYEIMYFNPEAFNLMPFFVPATKWYYYENKLRPKKSGHLFDFETGKSDEKAALKVIMDTREQLGQLPDKQDLFKFMQNQPVIPADMFVVTIGGNLDIAKVNERIQAVMSDPKALNKVMKGHLVEDSSDAYKISGGLRFEANPQGRFHITEHPINHLYRGADIGGVDDYMKNKADQSPSKGAIVIYRRFISADVPCKIPVLTYWYRPPTLREFYEDTLKAARYYSCELAFEMNTTQPDLSPIYEFYKSKGMLKHLKQYALILGKGVRKAEAFGYQVRQNEIDITDLKLNDFIASPELNNVFDLDFLNQLAMTGRMNTDIISAFRVCLLYNDDIRLNPVKKILSADEMMQMEELQKNEPPKRNTEFAFGMGPDGKPVPTFKVGDNSFVFDWQKDLRAKYNQD